jgi:adenosine deaminase
MNQKTIQYSLLSETENVAEELIKLQKIDLHRHLLGSVSSDIVLKIAQEYSLKLPTTNKDKLDQKLTIQRPVNSLREFFRPWKFFK